MSARYGHTVRVFTIPENVDATEVLGPVDAVLHEVEKSFPRLTFVVRGHNISIISQDVLTEPEAIAAENLFEQLSQAAQAKAALDADSVRRLLSARRRHFDAHGRDVEYLSEITHKHAAGENAAIKGSASKHAGTHHTADTRAPHKSEYDTARKRLNRTQSSQLTVRETHTARTRQPSQVEGELPDVRIPAVIAYAGGVPVRAKTAGQRHYVAQIAKNTITFGIGPAGTGKTYLAVAMAVQAFQEHRVRRIILTRPAVEAGENLGYLPGTLAEKIDPYLRPLYDALSDMLGSIQLKQAMDSGAIEVAPLAYMRGRTLNDAFVILDEAQNTTEEQMKMFLTRLGYNSRMVVTGDITQVDLAIRRSGLRSIEHILQGIPAISFVHFTDTDVVRHSLVAAIVNAYNKHDEEREARATRAHTDPQRNSRNEKENR